MWHNGNIPSTESYTEYQHVRLVLLHALFVTINFNVSGYCQSLPGSNVNLQPYHHPTNIIGALSSNNQLDIGYPLVVLLFRQPSYHQSSSRRRTSSSSCFCLSSLVVVFVVDGHTVTPKKEEGSLNSSRF